MARFVALLALATSAHAFAPRHTMTTVRNFAHDWQTIYAAQYPLGNGNIANNWFSPGGPTSVVNNRNGQNPNACDRSSTTGDRLEDARTGMLPIFVAARNHNHTNEDIFRPRGVGGVNNRNNPWHQQYNDGFGNVVLHFDDYYVAGDTHKSNPLLAKLGDTIYDNLRKDGKAVRNDQLMPGGYYPFSRWPTGATAPAGWPVNMIQPAGGRVASAGTVSFDSTPSSN